MSSKKLILLSEQKSLIKASASAPQVDGQEKAFLKAGNGQVDIRYKNIVLKNISRVLSKLKIGPIADPFTHKKEENAVYLFIAVNQVYVESNMYLLKSLKKAGNKVSLYMYDVWEPDFDEWKSFFDEIGVDYLFFAYKDSTDYFKNLGYNAYWTPVSADYAVFKPNEDSKKTRMFMQMGRKNEELHEAILDYMNKHDIPDVRENYVYIKNKGELIYPDIHELAREISKTKYFVCIPKIYENYKRTGNVNDFICRYFEGMACKTLVIGKKPKTYDELFDYDCMISFDDSFDSLEEKIAYFENHQDEYEALVEKNYNYVMNNHSWGNRLDTILKAINE